ncbi:FkbM family methyltransferase [Leptospira sp. 201903070]|uniref:FkbM family methyltransferase n=1 Tax=Leptospira ainlahdjerensis TaxID=2810033 RepID=A0ABS2UEI1_9LEPT|nr:FkbM family methyltransferase [Leptospira ainlahdjerensis]MBM9577310.1 FkbM family methyltransferase [Leptospira ainlahdjerensis]
MKKIIKHSLAKIVSLILGFFRKSSIGRYVIEVIIHRLMNHIEEVEHNGKFYFTAPNDLNRFRANTFSTKEPETLEWIDQMTKDPVFWDIGANVGLYSIYAAKKKNAKVYSFEPSVFNLELLARNVFINRLSNQIVIIPLPLSEKLSVNTLQMTSTDWGGALSSFGETFGHDGKPMETVFEYNILGISMIDALKLFRLPKPHYIKMDVDGIEHLILKGGEKILGSVKEILVEINEDFEDQFKISRKILEKAGFHLKNRKASTVSNTGSFQNTYNQIWVKK